jgi:signal transduction histidine kinase
LRPGKLKLEKQPFSIVEQTTIVFETLRAKAEEKGIEFNMDFGTLHFAQYVLGDPVRYRQIIFNLVDNAIKFTDNGSVSLFLNYDSKWLEIKVVDSGIGIPEKNLKSIYKKFDRVSKNRKYEGTGLGLSIVKKAC